MELPTSLAYERSINPSDVCFLVVWPDGHKTPLTYTSRTVLGQMETAKLAYDPSGKIKASATAEKLAHSNLHTLDFCSVPFGASYVECLFSVSFSSELRKPYKCNSTHIKNTLIQLIKLYEDKVGWDELVSRYLINICNGSWLWKNTQKAYCCDVELTPWPWEGESVKFENIRSNYIAKEDFESHKDWEAIAKMTKEAFSQDNGLSIFEVKATLRLPTNKEIYPSQAIIEKEINSSGKTKQKIRSRIFQCTTIQGERSPIIGIYKAGAAIATIDDWYPDANEPLRIGCFGVHKGDVTCYRHPSTQKDLFSILKQADSFAEVLSSSDELNQGMINDLHFLVANIIKGGMFQHKGD